MKRVLRLLLSRRYAVGAIALLAALFAISSFVPDVEGIEELRSRRPQWARALEALAPERMQRSPIVLALVAFIAVGVAASIVTRTRAHLAARGKPVAPQRFRAERELTLAVPTDAARRRAADALRAAGLRVGDVLEGAAGRGGFWGSMAFHAGLLLVLAAVVATAFGRFAGETVLTETAAIRLGPETMLYASPADGMGRLAGTVVELGDVSVSYEKGTQLTDVSAVLSYRAGARGGRRFVSVNVPVNVEGYQFTLHRFGYAPALRAVRPDGRAVIDAVGIVRVLPPGTEDSMLLEDGGALRLRFYPDFEERGGAPASRTLDPVRPVVAWRWYESGALVAEGRVGLGETAVVNGFEVSFPELLHWASFMIGRDPGLPWLAVGAALAIGGLAIRFLGHERTWRADVAEAEGGSRVRVSLTGRYFPALLQERAERIVRAMSGREGSA